MCPAEAITSHTNLVDHLRKSTAAGEVINIAIVGSDLCCDFGEWLYSEGKELLGERSEWHNCVVAHAEFHLAAANVAMQISADSDFKSEQMMACESCYSLKVTEFSEAVNALFNS